MDNNIEKKINQLIEDGDLNEALELQEQLYFQQQIQYIEDLISENRYEEALELCDIFDDNIEIQYIKVKILYKLKRIDEVLEISINYENNEKVQRDEIIQNKNVDINRILLTRIYCNDITLDELENQDINDWDKIVLLTAYYEKNNKKMGIKKLKEYKQKSNIPPYKTKQINFMLERLISNKITFFDITVYGKLIKCHINEDLAQKIFAKQEEQRQKEAIEAKKVEVVVNKPSKISTTKVEQSQAKKDVSILTNSQEVQNHKKSSEVKKDNIKPITANVVNVKKESTQNDKKSSNNITKLLIKDLFKEEVLEVQLYLYVQMNSIRRQKDAVQAWDNFEEMIIKPVSDKEALNKMVQFLKRIEPSNDVSITVDEKKYRKYLDI